LPKKENTILKWESKIIRKYKGLELEFDLYTPDAEVEVILDRNSGHGMSKVMVLTFKINTLGKFNMGRFPSL
jgi:hypothetical protein